MHTWFDADGCKKSSPSKMSLHRQCRRRRVTSRLHGAEGAAASAPCTTGPTFSALSAPTLTPQQSACCWDPAGTRFTRARVMHGQFAPHAASNSSNPGGLSGALSGAGGLLPLRCRRRRHRVYTCHRARTQHRRLRIYLRRIDRPTQHECHVGLSSRSKEKAARDRRVNNNRGPTQQDSSTHLHG